MKTKHTERMIRRKNDSDLWTAQLWKKMTRNLGVSVSIVAALSTKTQIRIPDAFSSAYNPEKIWGRPSPVYVEYHEIVYREWSCRVVKLRGNHLLLQQIKTACRSIYPFRHTCMSLCSIKHTRTHCSTVQKDKQTWRAGKRDKSLRATNEIFYTEIL